MIEDSNHGETTVIQSTLQHLHTKGVINVKDISRETGIDDSAIYKWFAGADPSATRLLQVFRCVCPEAQQAILNDFIGGTPWNCFWTPTDDDLDVTGDGKINMHDAIESHAQGQAKLVNKLSAINMAMQDNHISHDEMLEIDAIGQAAIREILRAIAIIHHVNSKQVKRRKCQPLHAGGGAA